MEANSRYVLDSNGTPVLEPDLLTWAKWLETAERKVKETIIGSSKISTVFLGLDYNFGEGPPLLWETKVFGGPLDGEMERYHSRAAALKGHKSMCERCLTCGLLFCFMRGFDEQDSVSDDTSTTG